MTKGVWNNAKPGARSAAAKKGAQARNRTRARRTKAASVATPDSDRAAFVAFLRGGPPLPCPEQGTATDRVSHEPVSSIMARLRAKQAEGDVAGMAP